LTVVLLKNILVLCLNDEKAE